MVTWAEKIRTKARAAAHHLPELGLRADRLGEDEIHDLRHVDPGVEHVDRDSDVGRLVLSREVVDEGLGVETAVVGDDARELPCVARIGRVEAFLDVFRVSLVLSKDDGLAEAVAPGDLSIGAQS